MAATDLFTSSQPGGTDILPACTDEPRTVRDTNAGVLVPASARCESACVSRSEEAGLAVASGADRSRQINASLSPVASQRTHHGCNTLDRVALAGHAALTRPAGGRYKYL